MTPAPYSVSFRLLKSASAAALALLALGGTALAQDGPGLSLPPGLIERPPQSERVRVPWPGDAPVADPTLAGGLPVDCQPVHELVNRAENGTRFGRTICADVVALDQTLVYNRFGSFNPFGMLYALRRDVAPLSAVPTAIDADACDAMLGTEPGGLAADGAERLAGKVRLKDCKRPRPIVLRANVGDVLHVRMANLLKPAAPDLSADFCAAGAAARGQDFDTLRSEVSRGDAVQVAHGERLCDRSASAQPRPGITDWPTERGLNFAVQGLSAFGLAGGEVTPAHDACVGLGAIPVDRAIDCYYRIEREGPFFLTSTAAPAGGQGDGGSLVHGLFGAVVVENAGSEWFRSQTTQAAFRAVWPAAAGTPRHAVDPATLTGLAAYRTLDKDQVPILAMLQPRAEGAFEIVHSDLNAIVHSPAAEAAPEKSFREFGVFFHDELKAFYTRNFDELGQFEQLAGARDGFAINYGASGMGTLLLANRKGIGPAANCAECLYEEFFLTSWANGDPALLEHFPDDPSNVHHSYLNDAVVYRNFHAGPKETHVFHLHAHQWFAGNDKGRGAYLDSQTVAPQQAFSYDIYGGGLDVYHPSGDPHRPGWFETLGSGNRNRTIGDSIFHCHLYPHFAQGMWELWRVHDVLEDGTRKLPDGQWQPGFSLAENPDAGLKRPGSVHRATGRWIDAPDSARRRGLGTPVPAIIPLPGQAWPLLPSYADGDLVLASDGRVTDSAGNPPAAAAQIAAMPGYPFIIAGEPGHRPPQAPLDLARAVDRGPDATDATDDVVTDEILDGGLPRHVMLDGSTRKLPFAAPDLPASQPARAAAQSQVVAKALAMGDMTMKLESAALKLIAHDGDPLAQSGMRLHADGAGLALYDAAGTSVQQVAGTGGYPSLDAAGATRSFSVNGAAPKPGAPFADPCGGPAFGIPTRADPFVRRSTGAAAFAPDPAVTGYRRYEGSAVQLDLITNRAGWHDPQARINVLSDSADAYKDQPPAAGITPARWSPRLSASEQPFFFRALSGECIEFRHTNELPHVLELDDFQVRTPTDTIGQHIHLVKFDVTSSDGSGNGFNYEDGTFAPDEIAHRICAAKNAAGAAVPVGSRAPGALAIREAPGLCEQGSDGTWHVSAAFADRIWRLPRGQGANRDLFQTTVQRWFADPLPTSTGAQAGSAQGAPFDRTLRTVFSHDHFGPSSIQQHGFYTALIIEPSDALICDSDAASSCTPQRQNDALILAGPRDVGARKLIRDRTPLDPDAPDFREFALAIADFALLYDPRDHVSADALKQAVGGDHGGDHGKGLATLVCEGQRAGDPAGLAAHCGAALSPDGQGWNAAAGNMPPAWVAAGRPGDLPAHQSASLLTAAEFAFSPAADDAQAPWATLSLGDRLLRWRRMAAGHAGTDANAVLARPVSPPARPESISVDHHDPYLVNYRGEPLPLRLGTSSSDPQKCLLKPRPEDWVGLLSSGVTDADRCEISVVRSGPAGDPANVLRSGPLSGPALPTGHGDPATGVLTTNENDPVLIRLIQGAQEVQHTFNIEGYTWPRNLDQAFPAQLPRRDDITAAANPTLTADCHAYAAAGAVPWSRQGRATSVGEWMRHGKSHFPDPALSDYWTAAERLMADCFNIEGRVAAQEIGISEHFEFRAAYLHQTNISGAGAEIRFRTLSVGRGNRQIRLLDQQIAEATALLQKTQPSDSLMHFGSVDALWNGAWTLLRVFPRKPLAPAYAVRLEEMIGRLRAARLQIALPPVPGRPEPPPPGPRPPDPIEQLLAESEALLAAPQFVAPYAPDVRPDPTRIEGPILRPDLPLDLRPPRLPVTPMQSLAAGIGAQHLRDMADSWHRLRGLAALPSQLLSQALARSDDPAPPPRGRRLAQAGGQVPPVEPRAAEGVADITRGAMIAANDAQLPPTPLPSDSTRQIRSRQPGPTRPPDKIGRRLSCDSAAPQVYAAVVAIDARSVFGDAPYGGTLSDPDGLFLALVDPRKLVAPENRTPTRLDEPDSWAAVSLGSIRAEIRRTYTRPEPLVMNVNAGDCVHVAWLNALPDAGGGRLPDRPGDAQMPRITSINVDMDWHGAETPNQPVDFHAADRADVVPSNRLALSFPLPLVTQQFLLARPYGINPFGALRGLPPHASDATLLGADATPSDLYGERSAQIELTEFYAGLAYGTPPDPEESPLVRDLVISRFDPASRFVPRRSGLTAAIPEPAAADPLTDLLDQLVDAPDAPLRPLLDETTRRATAASLRGVQAGPGAGDAAELPDLPPPGGPPLIARPQLVPRPDGPGLDLSTGRRSLPLDRAIVELQGTPAAELLAEVQAADQERQAEDQRQRAAAHVAAMLTDRNTIFVPYAFGALPVKPVGDIIGHASHGLIGSINVVPQRARIEDTRVSRLPLGLPLTGCLVRRLPRLDRADWPALPYFASPPVDPARGCRSFVLVPQPPVDRTRLMSGALLKTPGPSGRLYDVRQFTLFWQDGLNLTDHATRDRHLRQGTDHRLVANCRICDDSYDWGEKGTGYRSAPFALRLREGGRWAESHYDLNGLSFGPQFFRTRAAEAADPPMPVLRAIAGEQITVHIVHAGGRARQRAFATISQDYDDLFHGFGFPRAALLAPGKAMTAQLLQLAQPRCWLWFDGPTHLRAGGTWGLFDVLPDRATWENPDQTSCRRRKR